MLSEHQRLLAAYDQVQLKQFKPNPYEQSLFWFIIDASGNPILLNNDRAANYAQLWSGTVSDLIFTVLIVMSVLMQVAGRFRSCFNPICARLPYNSLWMYLTLIFFFRI